MKTFLAYTIPVLLCLAVGALGSYVQSSALAAWYPTLTKSPITPPNIVFPIAWTILYILMGLSIGRLVSIGDFSIIRLWILQLLVNFLWSVAFFSLRSPILGLITILVLVVLVFAYTMYAFSSDRIAGWLFVPYLLWLLFATYLTGYVYLNNDSPSYALHAANVQHQTIITDSSSLVTMPALPYDADALEPAISEQTMDYHYGKHLKTYIDNYNRLVVDSPYNGMSLEEVVVNADGALLNNAAQVWNHILFFDGMTPKKTEMTPRMKGAIIHDFGSVENFKNDFTKAATALFGSGWVWLTKDSNGILHIRSTSNAECPMQRGEKPILVLDVWEHAYYIDYRNRRADFIQNWWDVVDWDVADSRYSK